MAHAWQLELAGPNTTSEDDPRCFSVCMQGAGATADISAACFALSRDALHESVKQMVHLIQTAIRRLSTVSYS